MAKNEPESQPAQLQGDGAVHRQQVEFDEAEMGTTYANFCRVISGFEELLVDFALNPSAMGNLEGPLKVDQRIVMNYYTAKKLRDLINVAIHRHETMFGELETDVQQRLKSNAANSPQA
ncbi:MAG: DUF3467 domain-containing protein [bacterium]|nr:DUF3467 domain-containing protein [bacterium]